MLTKNSEIFALLKLSVPLILTQLAQVAITFTDTLMMGLLGSTALAGAGLGATIFSFLQILGLGVITVVSNLVAKNEKNHQQVKNIVHAGLVIASVLFILFGALLWFIGPILLFLGQAPDAVETAVPFLHALLWGMLPNLLFITLRAFSVGVMRPGFITIITIAAIGLNVVLNLFFIHFFPELGVAGLGIASSLVFLSMFICLAINIASWPYFEKYQIFRDFWSFSTETIFKILRLGIPMGIIFAFEAGFFLFGVLLIGMIGTHALAAHNIAMQFAFLTYMVTLGIANATSVAVSQAYGEQHLERVRLISYTGLKLSLWWMTLAALVFWRFPEYLVNLFNFNSEEELATVMIIAIELLLVAAVFQLFDGVQALIIAILRSLEKNVNTMIITFVGYWLIGAPLAYLFGFIWDGGAPGVWWGLASGLAATALISWLFLQRKIGSKAMFHSNSL